MGQRPPFCAISFCVRLRVCVFVCFWFLVLMLLDFWDRYWSLSISLNLASNSSSAVRGPLLRLGEPLGLDCLWNVLLNADTLLGLGVDGVLSEGLKILVFVVIGCVPQKSTFRSCARNPKTQKQEKHRILANGPQTTNRGCSCNCRSVFGPRAHCVLLNLVGVLESPLTLWHEMPISLIFVMEGVGPMDLLWFSGFVHAKLKTIFLFHSIGTSAKRNKCGRLVVRCSKKIWIVFRNKNFECFFVPCNKCTLIFLAGVYTPIVGMVINLIVGGPYPDYKDSFCFNIRSWSTVAHMEIPKKNIWRKPTLPFNRPPFRGRRTFRTFNRYGFTGESGGQASGDVLEVLESWALPRGPRSNWAAYVAACC